MSPLSLVVLGVLLVGLKLAVSWFRDYQVRQRMPPSPPGVPVFGNLLQIPLKEPWHIFAQWKDRYGALNDSFLVRIGGNFAKQVPYTR